MPNYHIVVYDENKKLDEFDRDFADSVEVQNYAKSKYPDLAVISTKN